jgi:F-type H+-transporting ATPase subunit b
MGVGDFRTTALQSAQGAERSVDFNASMLVIVAIFGIAYWVLKVTLFDRLLRIINRREAKLATARDTWQRATDEAQAALDAERQRLLAARRDAAAHRDTLRREAQDQRQAVLEAAKSEAQGQLEASRQELQALVEREQRDLEGRSQELASRVTERLVGRAV